MENSRIKPLVLGAMIAAAYTALSLALAPISFGAVQFRVSEALTLLPVLYPPAILGVTLGCAITNAAGAMMGTNFLGLLDVPFGAAATLAAALLTAALARVRIRGLALPAAIPPVVLNAMVIGGEWCYTMTGGFPAGVFAVCAGQIALGQLVPCCVLGVLLVKLLEKHRIGL